MKPDIRPDTGYKKGRISGTTLKKKEYNFCVKKICIPLKKGEYLPHLPAAGHHVPKAFQAGARRRREKAVGLSARGVPQLPSLQSGILTLYHGLSIENNG